MYIIISVELFGVPSTVYVLQPLFLKYSTYNLLIEYVPFSVISIFGLNSLVILFKATIFIIIFSIDKSIFLNS